MLIFDITFVYHINLIQHLSDEFINKFINNYIQDISHKNKEIERCDKYINLN